MPPKKAGKSKGKEATGPKKMSKKEKKLAAKYGMVQAEDQSGKENYVMGMRRDELEWCVEKLQGQVQVNREERIKFQLERDFLYDIMQAYWQKWKCLKTEQEKKIADTNRMNQDADDNKIIKSIEGKHFRYDSQMKCSEMDVRDEIRKKKLKDMLEKSWQSIALDIEDQNAILAANSEKYRKSIDDTVEKLDDLQKYVDDHANQLTVFTKDLQQQMENSLKLFHLTRRMEFQMTEERWSEFIWKLSHNFELQYEAMKNYYNDAAHSNITLVFTLQDWMNDSLERMKMYQEKILDYEILMLDAHNRMPSLRTEYVQQKVKHDFIVRTKRGIKTTKKEVALTTSSINNHKMEHRQLIHELNVVNTEKNYLKNNCEEIIGEVMDACKFRYDIEKEDNEMVLQVNRLGEEKSRLRSHFPTQEVFNKVVTPYQQVMDKKDNLIEKEKLKSMRLLKQTEDLRNSLEARLFTVGLKKKHAIKTPEQNFLLARPVRLDWGPANLVAKSSYPKPIPIPPKPLKCMVEDENDVKLCLTESVRGFLAWKQKQKAARLKKERETGNK